MNKMEKLCAVAGVVLGIGLTSLVNCSNGAGKVDNVAVTSSPYDIDKFNEDERNNAVRMATGYNKIFSHSKKKLIEDLTKEGFSEEVSRYAVRNIEADWKENCLKSAYSYLDLFDMSREELISQLEYDQFTIEEINYAIEKIYK